MSDDNSTPLNKFRNIIQSASDDAYIHLKSDSQDPIAKAPKSFWERLIAWFTGSNKQEESLNKTAIDSLRVAVEKDFGRDALSQFDKNFASTYESGKPLKAFMIKEILKDMDDYKEREITKYTEEFIGGLKNNYTNVEKKELFNEIKTALHRRILKDLAENKNTLKEVAEAAYKSYDANRNKNADTPQSQPAPGLKNLGSGTGKAVGNVVQGSGKTYEQGQEVGRHIFEKDKEKGVEPGFVGTKRWADEDEAKLMNEAKEGEPHKFYSRASAIIEAKLQEEGSEPNIYQKAALAYIAYIEKTQGGEASARESPQDRIASFCQKNPDLKTDLFKAIKSDKDCHDAIVKDIMIDGGNVTQKFLKKHYVKLDYKEADMATSPFSEKLALIPPDRAHNIVHLYGTAKTRHERNLDAMRECLVNDLMIRLGVFSQKLKLVLSQYEDKYPKLLLDGTHLTDKEGNRFDDFGRKPDDEKFVRGIIDGCLVEKDPDDSDCLRSDQTIEKLGAYKVILLLFGDRDAIGSRGDNKGFVKNKFAAIDPGHSLQVGGNLLKQDPMDFENMRTDFSFKESKKILDRLSGGFKNFRIFNDRPLSEKMEGIRMIQALKDSGGDIALFDEYMATFDGSISSDLSFKEEIQSMKEAYIKRRDYVLGVFEKRAAFIAEPQVLDSLDGLEKLTSVTSDTSPSGKIPLNYPRVIRRQEWHVVKNEAGDYVFFARGGDKEKMKAEILKKLQQSQLHESGVKIKEENENPDSLFLIVQKDKINQFYNTMNPKIKRTPEESRFKP